MAYHWACPKGIEYRQMTYAQYEELNHPFIGHTSGVRKKKGHFDFNLNMFSDSAYNLGEKIVLATHCPFSLKNIQLVNSLSDIYILILEWKKKISDFSTFVNSSAFTRQLF